ncbi:GTF2I repeat domain containing 2, partial [Chelydra serpentina]
DINNVPRLAIVARYCASDEIQEERCCLKPLNDTTKGEDIVESFVNHFEERGVDIRKLFCVRTAGAPAMVGKQKGFVKLLENQIGCPTVKFHCIIHQENLCAKISNSELNNIMNTVVRIVNFLVA